MNLSPFERGYLCGVLYKEKAVLENELKLKAIETEEFQQDVKNEIAFVKKLILKISPELNEPS